MTPIIYLHFNLSLLLNISLCTPLACIQVCSLCVAVSPRKSRTKERLYVISRWDYNLLIDRLHVCGKLSLLRYSENECEKMSTRRTSNSYN